MDIVRGAWRRLKASNNPAARAAVRLVRGGRRWTSAQVEATRKSKHPVAQFLTNPHYRWRLRINLLQPREVHQTAARTRLDRYPEIFSAVRDQFGDGAAIKILSFGCSTGEEVLTLRKYFPAATIVGAEINPRSLAICRKLPVDDRVTFVRSEPRNIGAHAPFDAVFCMAVLQRDPQLVMREKVTSLRKVYPFERFDGAIRDIDSWLRPGGILAVHHAHYFLGDSSVASSYSILDRAAHLLDTHAKFDREGQLIAPEYRTQSVFVKRAPQDGHGTLASSRTPAPAGVAATTSAE
jgi:hypothetical protein